MGEAKKVILRYVNHNINIMTGMKNTKDVVEVLRQYKHDKAESYGIEALGLIGSVARGTQQADSDIDVCVKLKHKSFRLYMKIKEELESLFCTKVDLVTFHENMQQIFRQNIERDAIYV